MSFFGSKRWRHHGFAVTAALLLLLTTTLALAGGRIEWGSKTLKPRSDNVSWNVEIAMFLPKPPDVPSVPMKFIFQQTVRYERSILDGDKHVENKTPVEGVQPIVESVDVGFLDPRSGKIEKRTKFTFKLHRDHGFECGEYKVTVRDARNDAMIGQPTTLIFGGQNEEVDRRSVVFSGEKKKEKKKADSGTADGEKAGDSEKKADAEADDPGRDKTVDTQNKLETPPEESNPAANEEVKKKPGGCGCSVPGQHSNRSNLGWLLALTALIVGRRFASKRVS
jgi:MYXO-CTERM domain-containing protein